MHYFHTRWIIYIERWCENNARLVYQDCTTVMSYTQSKSSLKSFTCTFVFCVFFSGIDEAEMAVLARENVFLLLEMGVYEATLELLGMEMERGRGVYEGTKTNITIADNHNLRGTLVLR